jgi:hypothetical protein
VKSAPLVKAAHKKEEHEQYFLADIREEHHLKPYLIHIQLDELFQ